MRMYNAIMLIFAELSDVMQTAIERQQQWTAADFVELAVLTAVCVGCGFLIDAALRRVVAKKSA